MRAKCVPSSPTPIRCRCATVYSYSGTRRNVPIWQAHLRRLPPLRGSQCAIPRLDLMSGSQSISRNSKLEARNPKQTPMTQIPRSQTMRSIVPNEVRDLGTESISFATLRMTCCRKSIWGIRAFVLVSDFDIRISNLPPIPDPCPAYQKKHGLVLYRSSMSWNWRHSTWPSSMPMFPP